MPDDDDLGPVPYRTFTRPVHVTAAEVAAHLARVAPPGGVSLEPTTPAPVLSLWDHLDADWLLPE